RARDSSAETDPKCRLAKQFRPSATLAPQVHNPGPPAIRPGLTGHTLTTRQDTRLSLERLSREGSLQKRGHAGDDQGGGSCRRGIGPGDPDKSLETVSNHIYVRQPGLMRKNLPGRKEKRRAAVRPWEHRRLAGQFRPPRRRRR